jgi:hypothetical protein
MARILRMHKSITAHYAVNTGIIRRMADRLACPRQMTDPGLDRISSTIER